MILTTFIILMKKEYIRLFRWEALILKIMIIQYYTVTQKPCKFPQGGWRYKQEELQRLENEGLLHFGIDDNTVPRKKLYLKDYLV